MDPYAITCREECGNIGFPGNRKWAHLSLVKGELVAVEVGEHVVLEHLLVTVQRKLLAAHGADFPVALHVLLKLVLIVVGREDDLAERTALHVHAANMWGWGRKYGGNAVRAPTVSSEVMMSAHTNKEHVSDASWAASS